MEREEGVARLPRPSNVSPPLLHFLNDQFQSPDHLSKSPDVELELRSRCSDLEASVSDLSVRLSAGFALYAAHSRNVGSLVGGVISTLEDLRSLIGSSSRDGDESDKILGEELPALAREVARVETVRAFAGDRRR
ncbi:hypothetical protein KSP40_PGU008079 [Platanthera guangdongensis]|uniref:Uncharacterized protein n=1 Tax=Platanthera guangdongensis TaxID=2320717 RepID=A0ABR2LRT6_9ASPA